VDIFYYATDRNDRPIRPGDVMLRFDTDGKAVRWSPAQGHRLPGQPVPPHRFDARRNWALIRILLTDSDAEVQWIFVRRPLIALLMREAVRVGEDPAVLARAAMLMHQPSDGDPHDDHMHVRFYCDPSDRSLGCVDRGPVRWWKKLWKYMAPPFGRASERSYDLADAFLRIMRTELPTLFFRRSLST
jgi:penicillin-insensitive murein endopeptidase